MSYLSFMPWTLQKRLLRYLLSQLDFLETDDLDLNNLGITWGQRSVVELKNVGLKAKKLSSILHLPETATLTSARLSHIKLTVPADILTSGVVTEISGVEIRLRVNPKDGRKHECSRSEQSRAPAKGTKSNRPRTATPTVHDPGGRRTRRRAGRYGSLEDSLLNADQAVHRLAESFLQTESREDRLELQAAIASQSRHEQESMTSSSGGDEDIGIGTAEGYTLPSFIASYLAGVVDRIKLHVSGVTVYVEFDHSSETLDHQQTGALQYPIFLLRLSELSIDSVDLTQDNETRTRKIVLHQFSTVVLPDPASYSPEIGSSEATSPILKHSQSNLSSSSSAFSAYQATRPAFAHSELPRRSIISANEARLPAETEQPVGLREPTFPDQPSTSPTFLPDLANSIDQSALFTTMSRELDLSGNLERDPPVPAKLSSSVNDDDVFRDPSDVNSDAGSVFRHRRVSDSGRSSPDDVDNQMHAKAHTRSGQLTPSAKEKFQTSGSIEDLTESKIFTHDEAESMYLSAMSGSKESGGREIPMPGAWNWSGQQADISDTPIHSAPEQITHDAPSNHKSASRADLRTSSASQSPVFRENVLEKDGASDSLNSLTEMPRNAKKLLSIDRISVWAPVIPTSDLPITPTPEQSTRTRSGPKDATRTRQADKDTSASVSLPDINLAEKSDVADVNSKLRSVSSPGVIEVEVLNVHGQFDMQLGKSLVTMANSMFVESEEVTKESKSSVPSAPISSLSVKISNIEVAFLEHVPELPVLQATMQHSSNDDVLLLSVRVAGLVYKTSSINRLSEHQLQLAKLSLSHSRGQFLSFDNDSSARYSLKDTVSFQKNDVEISIASSSGTNKVEVYSKPIRLALELAQLDDMLSRSGGLSSLLELGSSIASTSTIRKIPSNVTERRAEPRGVRFEDSSAPGPRSQDDLNFGLGKVNIRIGGLHVDVVGSECVVNASTSAIKIVHRAEGVGMQIDRISLQGPLLLGSCEIPDLSIDLEKVRMEYLSIPNDKDLDRLLAILTPSKDKYDADDDIMVDTLLRQRRKGGVMRLTVTSFVASLQGMSCVAHLAKIGTELGKLSTVAKYLPADDRPGILSLGLVKTFDFELTLGEPIGSLKLKARALEGAHVNVPSLLAAQIGTASIHREETESLLCEAVTYADTSTVPPMIMCRFVADEMDPTVKLKLFNVCLEYHVSFLTALMKTADSLSGGRSEDGSEQSSQSSARFSSPSSNESAAEFVRRTNISVAVRDSALALNPRNVRGRALFVVTDAVFSSPLNDSKDIRLSTEVKKASIMVINKADVDNSSSISDRGSTGLQSEDQARTLGQLGYVTVGYISSAVTTIDVAQLDDDGSKSVEVELRNALLIVESCADSTQTLINILNGLAPPAPPVKVSPYRTEIMPIEDLLASFSGDAFITEPGPEVGLRAGRGAGFDSIYSEQQDIEYVSDFYQPEDDDDHDGDDDDDDDDISESGIHSEMLDSEIAESTVSISVAPVAIRQSGTQGAHDDGMTNSLLDFRDDHFGRTPAIGGTAHRWDSTQNTYGLASERHVRKSPLKVRTRDVHIIWNLFDGYDWQETRDVISEAVKDIEIKAAARRPRSSRLSPGSEDEEDSVIGDFLFNSIYIGVPANKDPRELTNEINRDIDDLTSETGSYATTSTITGSPARHQASRPRQKKLKLKRSKQHKMTFELKGVSTDMLVFPPGSGEVQSSIDIRVKDLEIFDHIPTSTWKKFATYMRDAGEREADTSMIHIEILNVKPVPDLSASEMILKVTILPLRLHVDQDALDFMSRFFEFKDKSAPLQSTPSTPPFLQRVEVNPVRIKLDFKPKRVDYGGLRSGRTTEFMNFFILDQADMILRRIILYGVSGFDRLGIMLNSIWTPDVKRNQLPGILAGLAPIRSLVNVGSGVKDLVVIPMREYKKDGRIVRSIQKGALAFAKTTSKELIGLGAKLAIGTQTVLQNAETMLAPTNPDERPRHTREDPDSDDSETQKQISLYADQPIGVIQGLRGAYASLERDLLLAKDAIIAVPGEAMASGSATGAAKAILRQAPTVILRPAIGASKAVGKTLLGAGNTLDRENRRRVEEKYKRY